MSKSKSVPNTPKLPPEDKHAVPRTGGLSSPGTGTPIRKPKLDPSSGKSGAEKG